MLDLCFQVGLSITLQTPSRILYILGPPPSLILGSEDIIRKINPRRPHDENETSVFHLNLSQHPKIEALDYVTTKEGVTRIFWTSITAKAILTAVLPQDVNNNNLRKKRESESLKGKAIVSQLY